MSGPQQNSQPNEAKLNSKLVPRNTVFFIGGVQRMISMRELREHFGRFGSVITVFMKHDQEGRSRGYGWVLYRRPTEEVLRHPDHTINGVKLTVEIADSVPSNVMAIFNASNAEAPPSSTAEPPQRRVGQSQNPPPLPINGNAVVVGSASGSRPPPGPPPPSPRGDRKRSRSPTIARNPYPLPPTAKNNPPGPKSGADGGSAQPPPRHPDAADRRRKESRKCSVDSYRSNSYDSSYSDYSSSASRSTSRSRRRTGKSSRGYGRRGPGSREHNRRTRRRSIDHSRGGERYSNNSHQQRSYPVQHPAYASYQAPPTAPTHPTVSTGGVYVCLPLALCPPAFVRDPRVLYATLDQSRLGSLLIVPSPEEAMSNSATGQQVAGHANAGHAMLPPGMSPMPYMSDRALPIPRLPSVVVGGGPMATAQLSHSSSTADLAPRYWGVGSSHQTSGSGVPPPPPPPPQGFDHLPRGGGGGGVKHNPSLS